MWIPRVRGTIKRRLLVNYRVDPEVVQKLLPAPFKPKLQSGMAIAGICLIRLEGIRPRWIPSALGIQSENAAHRIAVTWSEGHREREGVFVPRRDSDSLLNQLAGGTLFPGEHHPAKFQVADVGGLLTLEMASKDGSTHISVSGQESDALPPSSCFESLEASSCFFEQGSLGYSVTRKPGILHGLVLETQQWSVLPFQVKAVSSSFFEDPGLFPPGSVAFDHALIMRDVEHAWLGAPDFVAGKVV